MKNRRFCYDAEENMLKSEKKNCMTKKDILKKKNALEFK